jgi:hypothetical protein
MTTFVAIAMAEIVSAVPSSGGPCTSNTPASYCTAAYLHIVADHWAALVAPPRQSAFAAWCTGYANLLGQASCCHLHL